MKSVTRPPSPLAPVLPRYWNSPLESPAHMKESTDPWPRLGLDRMDASSLSLARSLRSRRDVPSAAAGAIRTEEPCGDTCMRRAARGEPGGDAKSSSRYCSGRLRSRASATSSRSISNASGSIWISVAHSSTPSRVSVSSWGNRTCGNTSRTSSPRRPTHQAETRTHNSSSEPTQSPNASCVSNAATCSGGMARIPRGSCAAAAGRCRASVSMHKREQAARRRSRSFG